MTSILTNQNQNISYSILEKYRIIETNDISTISSLFQTNDTLLCDTLLCDLDNTLFTSKNLTGSSMFWDFIVQKTCDKKRMKRTDAINKITKLSRLLDIEGGAKPVDARGPNVLNKLESTGCRVIGFTARRPSQSEKTLYQIREAGYSFKGLGDRSFSLAEIDHEVVAGYQNSVVFSGNRFSKGEILKKLMDKTNIKGIVMIDDLKENLQSMLQACQEVGVPFTGIRFAKMDPLVKNFPMNDALYSLSKFLEKHPDLQQEYQYLLQ